MPATRKTEQHLDTLDRHHSALRKAGLVIRTAAIDGRLDAAELRAIDHALQAIDATYDELSDDAQRLDGALRVIGLIANTGDVTTPHTQRVIRETADGIALLAAAGSDAPDALDEAA